MIFFAGNEDGTGLDSFTSSQWSIPDNGDTVHIAAVERDLQMIVDTFELQEQTLEAQNPA